MKIYSPAWIPYLPILIAVLKEQAKPQQVILRLGRGVQQIPEFLYQLGDGTVIDGVPLERPILFTENGITFEADLKRGQKTGFFLDQRDNRARAEKLSQGKSVLNIFAYTGGFSVYAARGGAQIVTSLDISQAALETAQRNFAHNRSIPAVSNCQHETLAGDAFDLLAILAQQGRKFDLVIIDPPSFAKSRSEIEPAIKAYQRLTRLGLATLQPESILVQASCSSRVSDEAFFGAVHQAAYQAGRPLTEIERTFHALDHPIGFPEGKYLKCLFARG
jgi:23S rRNA (cytosine1962-C5)-methyltransferase